MTREQARRFILSKQGLPRRRQLQRIPLCIAMGQAAGTAAAMAVRNGQELREIDIRELQAQLAADGVFFTEQGGDAAR